MLTKQALTRLEASPVDVRLFNGCFNVATAKAKFSTHTFELRVRVTHPFLAWQCGNKNSVELIKWVGNIGNFVDVPESLNSVVAKLRQAATMTDDEARALSSKNSLAFTKEMCEMGLVSK